MRWRHLSYLLTLFCTSLFIAGCATNPATGRADFVLLSESDELALGQKTNRDIQKEFPLVNDPALQRYVQAVGERVAKTSHRPSLQYQFRVIDTADINAFALPGGYIYIHRGLLAYLNSEAQLAAVLAHEVGHVTARHTVRQHSMATAGSILSAIAAAYTGIGAVGDLGNLTNTALVRGYGRDHELEADSLGVEYLARAGYSPKAMQEVIEVLDKQVRFASRHGENKLGYHGLFSTHPSNDQRRQKVLNSAPSAHGEQGRDRYLQQINGLAFGDSSEQGVINGQFFYHKRLNFRLKSPSGWQWQNRPEVLATISPDQSAVFTTQLQKSVPNLPIDRYLQHWFNGVTLQNSTSWQQHGAQIYTAVIYPGERPPLRVAAIFSQGKIYQMVGMAKSARQFPAWDSQFQTAIRSFRPLTTQEKRLANGRQIKIITSRAGQSYGSIGQASALTKPAKEPLQLLNGTWPNGRLEPGTKLKTVINRPL